MKKILTALIAMLVFASLTVSAMAYTMYVATDPGKVYKKNSKKSDIISRLPYGGGVDVIEEDGDWMKVNYVNKKGVTKSGWMRADSLSSKQPHKHEWGKWKVTKEATCEKEGEKQRKCASCGKTETKKIEKLDHEWGKWKVTKEATCVQKGERTRTCKLCGKKQTKEYYEDHDFGSWCLTKEPTCTEKGERVRTCRVCGEEDRQVLDRLPHDYEWRVLLEPTDHSAGTRAKICRVCGHDGGEESFDPAGTLRRKDRGEDVYNMQQLLVEQGYLNAGGADGVFGGGTEKALAQYQKDRGLNADGIGWPQTLDDLQHDFGPWETVKEMTRTEAGERVRTCRGCGFEQHETIEPGEVFEIKRRGDDIRALQQMLTELGFNAGGYDGIYGKKLDEAMAGFAAAHGLTVEQGVVRPADVDAVMNAWLEAVSDDSWKGEGDADAPVSLALTVTPSGEADDSGIVNYTWSLTNLGGKKATYVALLLTFGDTPDFRHNDLVMNLDGVTLKPGSANSVSGSFSTDQDWGEGTLHFAALAVSDDDGAKWLSNDVTFENANSAAPKTIYPMAVPFDLNNIGDAVVPVAFNQGDIASLASGVYINAIHVYAKDTYAPADIEALKAGDTLMIGGQSVAVESVSVEPADPELPDVTIVDVNGGVDADGYCLWQTPDTEGYVPHMLSDLATYTELGTISLALDPSATYTDSSDIDGEALTVAYDGIADAIRDSDNAYFVQYNTTLHVVNNRIVEIVREYVP